MTDSFVEELAQQRLGRTIKGKWRLERLIGVGGMAAVYAATHRNGAQVAIKLLHATISASKTLRSRFVREGYLANKVDHPGIVRVIDDDVEDETGCAFLVMDLVHGRTLAERAMERLLDNGELLDVAAQVLSVLVAAHEKGIVHRDLKPDNLLVDDQGVVKVLDFGIARMIEDAMPMTSTMSGTAFGTPGFMAPEQARGQTELLSPLSDLYSLGATLFALATGEFLHASENPQELMILVATEPPRSLANFAPHLHRRVCALVDRATCSSPADRWPSARAMLAEVERLQRALKVASVKVLPLKDTGRTAKPSRVSTPAPLTSPVASAAKGGAAHKNAPVGTHELDDLDAPVSEPADSARSLVPGEGRSARPPWLLASVAGLAVFVMLWLAGRAMFGPAATRSTNVLAGPGVPSTVVSTLMSNAAAAGEVSSGLPAHDVGSAEVRDRGGATEPSTSAQEPEAPEGSASATTRLGAGASPLSSAKTASSAPPDAASSKTTSRSTTRPSTVPVAQPRGRKPGSIDVGY